MIAKKAQTVTNQGFLATENFKLMVFAYLPGQTIFHKVALMNQRIRDLLPNAALLDQIITITITKEESEN